MSQTNHRLPRRSLVLFIVLALLLVTTGTVLAQATLNYDLACRSALTSGGGTIVHGATASTGALGQFGAGTSQSATYGVHGGYIQAIPKTTVTTASAPALADQGNSVFIPWLSRAGRIIRACQY